MTTPFYTRSYTENGRKATNRTGLFLSAFRRLAPLFTLLYLSLFLLTGLHTHRLMRDSFRGSSAVTAQTEAGTHQECQVAHQRSGDTDCGICDFLGQPLLEAITPAPLTEVIAQVAIPAPPERQHPYRAFRFCDRSASRAPPVA